MTVYLPKGTKDFLPDKMSNRLSVIKILRSTFESFGFGALETPAFERIETLTGKYGDEGENLMYRIQKRGEAGKRGEIDLALRYDLTVPLARVMAMNPAIRMPFKRYQIQPVWRADRPQKGRFREFWQCDVDICGTKSVSADAECITIVGTCLEALGLNDYTIRINDRRILSDIARIAGADSNKLETQFLVSIDKLDKIGCDKVKNELISKGFVLSKINEAFDILNYSGSNAKTLNMLFELLGGSGKAGVNDLIAIIENSKCFGLNIGRLKVDTTLARGLSYYTGPIFEAVINSNKIGSVSGGGRYDRLIGMFSNKEIPAVGISLGLDRIITVMEELNLLPSVPTSSGVFVSVFSEDTRMESLKASNTIRVCGINVEVYLGESKLKSQMKYANLAGFRWVVIIGPSEIRDGVVTLKDLYNGLQVKTPIENVYNHIMLQAV